MGAPARAAAGPEATPSFRPPPAAAIAPGTPERLRLALTLLCRRPELRPLCAGVLLAVDPALDVPFRAVDGSRVLLHPASLAEPAAAAPRLRQALEAALWQRLGAPAAHLAPAASLLAAPSEALLVQGGGSRLELDPASGANAYGCPAHPCPDALAFASSTASSISAPAFGAVEATRQALLRAALAGDLERALKAEVAAVKAELLTRLGVADLGAEAVLLPSGTDGEFAALQIARRDAGERLVNLVIAPEETGSGVPAAAGGRHFAAVTPHGRAVVPGTPLAGLDPAAISVETVAIRGADGTPRPRAAVDAEVAALAERALAGGARCLIHLLEASKTGLAAPGRALLEDLRARHGERVAVVVDACQMRHDPAVLRADLERGWMVLVTGSKFFTGPPFCGALLLPAALAAPAGRAPLPAGFGDYFARPEWPDAWRDLTGQLPARPNLGLLLRWRAALWEMAAHAAVPEGLRARITAELGAAIATALQDAPQLEPVATAGTPPTIFPFYILQGGTALEAAAARRVWHWLRADLAGLLPDPVTPVERRLAAFDCRVGQPVALGAGAALRLCIGAHAISRVAFDPALGRTLEQRLARQIGAARIVVDKAALIARHLEPLAVSAAPRD